MIPKGKIYIKNKIGPSTDPCGTPYFKVTSLEFSLLK